MKVTTLACIQGAWLPDHSPRNILDIGAGTGVLSLMAAQKLNCPIDAVEVEKDAFEQLKDNVARSPWGHRIGCYHEDIRDFAKHNSKTYDLIISNPPFFENKLKSSSHKINQARHEIGLPLIDLVNVSAVMLSASGKLSILLPPKESERLIELCRQKLLFHSNQLVISDLSGKDEKAVITILSRKEVTPSINKLLIKNEKRQYSSEFTHLLTDYYLNL